MKSNTIKFGLGIILTILCILVYIYYSYQFISNEHPLYISLGIIIFIIIFFAYASFLLFEEKKIIKGKNKQVENFKRQVIKEINLNETNLNIQDINFSYSPKNIETIKFIIGSFFIAGLLGSFFGIGEILSSSLSNLDKTKDLDTSKLLSSLSNLKTVLGVSISGLLTALTTENFLQIIYSYIFELEKDLTSEVKDECLKILENRNKLLNFDEADSFLKINPVEKNKLSLNNKLVIQNIKHTNLLLTKSNEIISLNKENNNFNEKILSTFNNISNNTEKISKLEEIITLTKENNNFNEKVKLKIDNISNNTEKVNKLDEFIDKIENLNRDNQTFNNTIKHYIEGFISKVDSSNNELIKKLNDGFDNLKTNVNSVNKKLKETFDTTLENISAKIENDKRAFDEKIVEEKTLFKNLADKHSSNIQEITKNQQTELKEIFNKVTERQEHIYIKLLDKVSNLENNFIEKQNNIHEEQKIQNESLYTQIFNNIISLQDKFLEVTNNLNSFSESIRILNDSLEKSSISNSNLIVNIESLNNLSSKAFYDLSQNIENYKLALEKTIGDINEINQSNINNLNTVNKNTSDNLNTISEIIKKSEDNLNEIKELENIFAKNLNI